MSSGGATYSPRTVGTPGCAGALGVVDLLGRALLHDNAAVHERTLWSATSRLRSSSRASRYYRHVLGRQIADDLQHVLRQLGVSETRSWSSSAKNSTSGRARARRQLYRCCWPPLASQGTMSSLPTRLHLLRQQAARRRQHLVLRALLHNGGGASVMFFSTHQ